MVFFMALLLATAIGCGTSEDQMNEPPSQLQAAETPYGSEPEISAYLQAVNPYIRLVGELQLEVERARSTSGKATGKNLSEMMEQVRPRLEEALGLLEKIEPPPVLAPLHRDIKKLMIVRLDAYRMTIAGWHKEQEDEDSDMSLYKGAETKLAEANQIIQQLNEDLKKINASLQIARNVNQETPAAQ